MHPGICGLIKSPFFERGRGLAAPSLKKWGYSFMEIALEKGSSGELDKISRINQRNIYIFQQQQPFITQGNAYI